MLPLIQLGPNWFLPSYFLVISATYCICLFFVDLRARALDQSREMALDLSFALMAGGFIGARLFHVLYEEPQWYLDHPIEVIKFWHGGFVFYGGFIGALLAVLIALKLRRALGEFWSWADFFAPVCALGYALGRIGCLLDGCCFGRRLRFAVGYRWPSPHAALCHIQRVRGFFNFIASRAPPTSRWFYFRHLALSSRRWSFIYGVLS